MLLANLINIYYRSTLNVKSINLCEIQQNFKIAICSLVAQSSDEATVPYTVIITKNLQIEDHSFFNIKNIAMKALKLKNNILTITNGTLKKVYILFFN